MSDILKYLRAFIFLRNERRRVAGKSNNPNHVPYAVASPFAFVLAIFAADNG